MSFIRQGQDSKYVDLHGGSHEYIYDHGTGITGLGSYGEFIDALCVHAGLAGLSDEFVDMFQIALEDHYVEHRAEDTRAVGPKPEMAHIIAQHLDSRLDEMELTDDILEKLQDHAEEAFVACPECGETWRPTPYTPESQGDLCRDCNAERLSEMDVTADVSEPREYLEQEIPDGVAPEGFHDDEFYAACMEVFMDAEGEERQALHHQLGDAGDEVMDAVVEERPVDKDAIREVLDSIDNE